MSLNVQNFLCYYQFHPFAEELDQKKECCPLIAKVVLLWIFTVGIVPIIFRIAFYHHSYQIKKADDTPKINAVVQPILNNDPPSSVTPLLEKTPITVEQPKSEPALQEEKKELFATPPQEEKKEPLAPQPKEEKLSVISQTEQKKAPEQIVEPQKPLPKAPEKPTPSNPSDNRVLAPDFSNIDDKKFLEILKDRENIILPNLSVKIIQKYCHLFTKEHWSCITDPQAKQFDFRETNCERKKAFEGLFVGQEVAKRVKEFTVEKIHEFVDLFKWAHWHNLTDQQVLTLDFSKIGEDKKVAAFDGMLNPKGKSGRIAKLALKNIHEIYKNFYDAHWEWVGLEQMKNFDFSKADPAFIKKLFPNKDKAKLISKLAPEQQTIIKKHLDKTILGGL